MIKTFLTFFLLASCLFSKAQEQSYFVNWTGPQADSVKVELRRTGNDTLRMKMARSLSIYYQEINRDTALVYALLQMELAKKLNQKLWEIDSYDAAGWVLSQLKNYPLSLEYLLTAQRIAENKNAEKNIWNLEHFSVKLDPAYARLTALGFVYNDLSQLYTQTGDAEKELAFLRRGIDIGNNIGNDLLLGLLKSNLAKVKLRENQTDSVIYFGKQSLEHMMKSGYTTYEGYMLILIADAYILQGDYATAKSYLDKSVLANTVNRSVMKLPDAYISYAKIYQLLDQPDSSRNYLTKALDAFKLFSDRGRINTVYSLLYTHYRKAKKADSAYHYLQLYQELNDSLTAEERSQILASQNIAFNEQVARQEAESRRISKANANRTYALLAGISALLLIAFLLLRNNRTKNKANIQLQHQKQKIEQTLTELKSTQQQLIQAEKMASLGELTAGIAHEIQNPLNFVNNFSEINLELIEELKTQKDQLKPQEQEELLHDVSQNLEKILHHGKRADGIVKGMLQHSRSSSGQKELTDINKLADEYLRLAYHGLRAKNKFFNTTLKTDYSPAVGSISIIPQDIGRVLLNMITNAFHAVDEKRKTGLDGYEPTVSISTAKKGSKIEITVTDNGNGIPQHLLDKIFQPFFTTKPTGQGTGLGLSLSYDIVKAHGGEIRVETVEKKGTSFIISIPAING